MTVTPRERTRARTFALALDGGAVEDPTVLGMARLSESLAGLAGAGPSEAFRVALRQRIVAAGAVSVTPAGGLATPAPWRRRLVAASAAIAISGVGISATAVAAGDALPGDRLYEVKRAVESMQLALAGSEIAKAERYLAMAATRLEEVAALLAENPNASADPVLVEHLRTTMASMRDAIGEASALFFAIYERTGDVSVLAPLQDFVIGQAAAVTEVGKQLPTELARSQGALIDEMAGIGYKVASVTERTAGSAATALDRVGVERASRKASRGVLAYTATSVNEAMQSAEKAVQAAKEAAATSADQAAAASAPDAEANAAHSEAVQQEVQRLVELQIGGAGTVEDTDVDVKPREGKAGSAQASSDTVDGTGAHSVGSASQRLLSVLPVPGSGVDSTVPGSLSASLDLTGGLSRLANVRSER
ncbi:MAG: DUF5667 domain-containing protein [Sporichthyaceae bacterium]